MVGTRPRGPVGPGAARSLRSSDRRVQDPGVCRGVHEQWVSGPDTVPYPVDTPKFRTVDGGPGALWDGKRMRPS